MPDWFSPESPKLSGSYKRLRHATARARSIGLLIAVVLLIVFYYVGCSGLPSMLY